MCKQQNVHREEFEREETKSAVIRDKSLSEKAFEVRRRGLLKERKSHVKAALT